MWIQIPEMMVLFEYKELHTPAFELDLTHEEAIILIATLRSIEVFTRGMCIEVSFKIEDAYGYYGEEKAVAEKFQNAITTALGDRSFLTAYLQDQCGNSFNVPDAKFSNTVTRPQWRDHIIHHIKVALNAHTQADDLRSEAASGNDQ